MRQHAITKSNIQKIKNRTLKWKAKFECLAFEMKTLLEHTKSDRNTKHISIQQQNQAVNFNTIYIFNDNNIYILMHIAGQKFSPV